MIAKKEIEQLPILSAKAKGKDRFIGRIRMHNETIVMDVYDARKLMAPDNEEKDAEISFRWVCDKENYYTYIFKRKAWTKQGIFWAMHGYDSYYSSTGIRLDEESRKVAKEFLEGLEMNLYKNGYADRLKELEERIRSEKREKAYEQKRARIKAREQKRKPLPKDWDNWLKRTVYKEDRYLFYDAQNRKQGVCAYCGEAVELDGKQGHNKRGRCPSCGSRIQYKALKKTGGAVKDRRQAIYLQKTEDGFLTRYIQTDKISSPSGERYKSYDIVLGTYNGKKTWYDYCVVSGLTGDEYWDDKKPSDMYGWEAAGYLYTRNVKQALKDTVFRYAPLAKWMRHEGQSIPFCDFMAKYENSPFLEFFIKAGLYTLTGEYVKSYQRWSGTKPQEILRINRQRINRLIQMDGGMLALEWLQREEKENLRIPDETLRWLEVNEVRPERCQNILKELGSVQRMVNYMEKQDVAASQVAGMWKDYLRMARNAGLDTTDDIVRFPKDLRARHNQLVETANAAEEKERLEGYVDLDRQIQERLPEVKRYFWENEKYIIIPAGKCEELMAEGRTLHHCVGRNDHYMKKMAEGQSWILFLRKKEEIESPYYTLEINMNSDQILQWYSKFDRQPDAVTIRKVLETFQKHVKRKRARVA